MKTNSLIVLAAAGLLLSVQACFAQSDSSAEAPWTAAARGPHETRWELLERELTPLGREVMRTRSFVELATSLNFFNETTQAWEPSREEWQVYPEGIVAQNGRHKVILATANLTLGSCVEVDILTADQVRVVCAPISLGFYDPVDGKQLAVAEVKPDCKPERGAAPNEILFRDCFDRVRGSLRFIYNLAGVRQHIVLEQKLELPDGFSDKSRLECYTVFAPETPAPALKTRVLRRETNPVLRAQMVEPDFTDSEISFGGEMTMRAGKAFCLGDEGDETQGPAIRVGKQFVEIDGFPVLVEAVEFKQLEPLLAGLAAVEGPKTDGLAANTTRRLELAANATERTGARASLNERRSADAAGGWAARLRGLIASGGTAGSEIQLASRPLEAPAVVVDWEYLSSQTNYTIRGDQTFFVTNAVYLDGVTTIEGSACVKFSTNSAATITVYGAIECKTDAYRPAFFTAQDFNGVGETVSGSSGNPSGYYGGGLVLNTTGNTLHDLRFAYMSSGVRLGFDSGQINLANMQFIKCQYPVDSVSADENTIVIDNGLFVSSYYVIRGGDDLVVRGRHLTVNQCSYFGFTGFGSTTGDLYLTNSLIVAATNGWGQFSGISGSVTTNNTVFFTNDPGGIFQTVAGGAHYLSTNSPYRNAGTTNIHADLLASLKTKTTYPPIAFTNVAITNVSLGPQAQRDTDPYPALGYHYEPIDWLFGRCDVNADLTFQPGTAVGWFRYDQGWGQYGHGIHIADNKVLTFNGRVDLPCWFVHQTVAQEQRIGYAPIDAGPGGIVGWGSAVSNTPVLDVRFTRFSGLPIYRNHFRDSYGVLRVSATDCEFYGGGVGGYVSTVGFTNCFFDRANVWLDGGVAEYFALRNCTARGGSVWINRWPEAWGGPGTGWVKVSILDCAFDQTAFNVADEHAYDTNWTRYAHNAYLQGQPTTDPDGTNDLTVTNFNWQSSWFGDFYQPTNSPLINSGSVTNAALLGLYHYTITTNQVKESSSRLDIGFHFASLDASGSVMDSDADGLADYLEDTNGNGTYATGDLANWQNADTDSDGANDGLEMTQGRNPLIAGTVPDSGGLINLRVFTPLK